MASTVMFLTNSRMKISAMSNSLFSKLKNLKKHLPKDRTNIVKGFKFRVYPTEEQKQWHDQIFGTTRYVYNWALQRAEEYRKESRDQGETKKYLSEGDLIKEMQELIKDRTRGYGWISNHIQANTRNAVIKNLSEARLRAAKGISEWPKIKSGKKGKQSAYFHNQTFIIEHPDCRCTCKRSTCLWHFRKKGASYKLPRVDDIGEARLLVSYAQSDGAVPLKVVFHRRLPVGGYINSMTLSRDSAGREYVSFSVTYDGGLAKPDLTNIKADEILALDLGISRLATLSDGTKIDNPRWYVKYQERLAHAQRAISKKVGPDRRSRRRPSNRWLKQNKAINKIHRKIADKRKDYTHKFTRETVDRAVEGGYKAIAMETLNAQGMSRNKNLAKHVLDANFYEVARQFEYKCEEAGLHFVKIPQFFPSSKVCHKCHHKFDQLTLNMRHWVCVSCGSEHDRDLNAAKNIQEVGHIMLSTDKNTVNQMLDHLDITAKV